MQYRHGHASKKGAQTTQCPSIYVNFMKLFDSHCHLDDPVFGADLAGVLQRARDNGVAGMLIAGVTLETSRRAIRLAETHPGIYASVGIHPHDASGCSEQKLDDLAGMAAGCPKVRAWGEIGLDFNRMYSPQAAQERWLVRQIEKAGDLQLPVIFHERDSGGRLIELVRPFGRTLKKAVVHCFSGSGSELADYLALGFYIGVTGIVTMDKRGAPLRALIPQIPETRLLIETDAPYLTPAPQRNRHRRNEPAFVRQVLLKLAEVRRSDPVQLARSIWQNTCRLYGIAASP